MPKWGFVWFNVYRRYLLSDVYVSVRCYGFIMKKNNFIFSLFILILFGIMAKNFESQKCLIAVGVLLAAIAIRIIIGRIHFERQFKICPRCGSKTKKQRCRRTVDPQKERIVFVSTRFFSGTATLWKTVVYCSNCGWNTLQDQLGEGQYGQSGDRFILR